MKPSPVPAHILKRAMQRWQQLDGDHWLPVHGRSMQPLLRDGDAVRVRHGALPRRGDLVVFRQGAQLITHRVLRVRRRVGGVTLRTQGDAAWRPDPEVAQTAVLGRVTHLRRGSRLINLERRRWRVAGWLLANHLRAQTAVFNLTHRVTRSRRAAHLLLRLWRLPRRLLLRGCLRLGA